MMFCHDPIVKLNLLFKALTLQAHIILPHFKEPFQDQKAWKMTGNYNARGEQFVRFYKPSRRPI